MQGGQRRCGTRKARDGRGRCKANRETMVRTGKCFGRRKYGAVLEGAGQKEKMLGKQTGNGTDWEGSVGSDMLRDEDTDRHRQAERQAEKIKFEETDLD